MTVAASVLGYAGLGFITRCYALGIQKRNIFDSKFSLHHPGFDAEKWEADGSSALRQTSVDTL
jgi:hypothetical protein